jgi:gliding motility-associated-like protein
MYVDSFVWIDYTSKSRLLENDTFLLATGTAGTTPYLLRGYQTYDGKTCFREDTASLKINGLPVITNRPQPVPLCQDQGMYNLGTVQTSNPAAAQTTQVWSYPPNPNAFASPGVIKIDSLRYLPGVDVGKAFGNYIYLSVKANTTGCFRRDSLLMGIFPVAPISIAGPPKFCDFDKGYSLYNLTIKINPTSNNENWYGRGLSYNSVTRRYTFTPSDTNNVIASKNVRTGLTLATDSNILKYEFIRIFPPTVQTDFFPPRPITVTMSSPSGGCASSDTVLFRVTKSPQLRAGLLPTVCSSGDSVYLSLRAIAGTNSTTAVNPQTSYWYFAAPNRNLKAIARGQVFMPFHSDIVVPNNGQNTYSLVYADTSTGCRAADTTDIRVKGIPNVSIVTNPISDSAVCSTQDKMFFTLDPLPDFLPPIDSISLTGAPGLVASIGNPLVYLPVKNNPLLQEQAYKLSYYYRTSEGCSNIATKDVRIQFPPEVSLSKNGSACEYAGSFTVDVLKSPSAKHPYGLLWSVLGGTGVIESQNNTQLVYTPSAAEKAAGKVNISIVTTNNGLCPVAGDTSVFTIYPKPTASFSGVDSGCVRPGKPLNINLVSGPNSVVDCRYIWEVDGTVEADSVNKTNFSKLLTVAKTYNMRLIVTNPLTGCSDSSVSQTSTAWPTPVADFDPDKTTTTIAKPYFTFTNKTNPLAGNTYDWDLGIDPQTGLPRRSTLVNPKEINFAADTASIPITLIAMSDKGCIDSITKFIKIEPDITVFIPNVFYPSTGGNSNTGAQTGPCMIGDVPCNRYFFIQANGFQTIEIYVYNRWGKLVFQTDKITEGWDGNDQKSGGECQQDAYVYQIFATSYSGKKYQYAGSVTLLR